MKYLLKIGRIGLVVLMFSLSTSLAFSQPGGPGCDPELGGDPNDVNCPIDGGVIALLAVGAGLGILKVRESQKAKLLKPEEL